MSIIANIAQRLNIKWFRKAEKPIIDTIPEPTDVWVPTPVIEPVKQPAKPKSNRKPGPKKQVPGKAAVKSNPPKTTNSGPKKPRKPKPKVDHG
jgi:hypothetical protein